MALRWIWNLKWSVCGWVLECISVVKSEVRYIRWISLSVHSIQSETPTQISKTNFLIGKKNNESEGKPAPCPIWVQMHTVNMNIHFIKVVLSWKLKHSHASVTHWLPQAKKKQTPVWSGPGPGFALLKVTHSCVLPHLLHIYASEGSSSAPGVSRRVVPGTYPIWTKSYQYIVQMKTTSNEQDIHMKDLMAFFWRS